VSFDREVTLKKAEKLLRQGRLEPAIAEYLRVVEAEPGDWITANTLGDLYVRAGQPDKAVAQFSRIAQHFGAEGFLPKAAALYKKLLKLSPEDETAQLQLADISHQQGLLADAKAHLNAVAARRRGRGDRAGTAEIVVRLGSVDPNDFEARLAAARTLVEMGDEEGAATRFRRIYDDLVEKDRQPEALVALREAVKLNPYDREGRIVLAKTAVASGDIEGARAYLDRETAGDDPVLLAALLEVDLKSGHLDEARQIVPQILAFGPDARQSVTELAWSTATTNPDAGFVVVDAIVEATSAARDFSDAAAILQEFIARVPNHIPALMKLIEASVDGGLESTMNEAQGQLADAYLIAGQAALARVIAEDLVAREPWEREHINRFRRALVMLKVAEPDSLIAERLSGMAPFLATDVFADQATLSTPAVQPESDAGPVPVSALEWGEIALSEIGVPATAVRETPQDAPSPPPPSGDQKEGRIEIDLSGALGDLHGGDNQAAADAEPRQPESPAEQNLDSAFQNLRKDSAQQGAADQSAQHMTLARTSLEMGMQDQAITAFKAASRSPRFRFEAASALGRMHKERGEIAEAAEWLERASEAPAPTIEEWRALAYDLGAALEETGETARALAIFLELQSEVGEYRDLAARIEHLARVETETEG